MGSGYEESVLFRYLHAADIPYRHYPRFEFNLVRGVTGGVCTSGMTEGGAVCSLLDMAGAIPSSTETGWVGGW